MAADDSAEIVDSLLFCCVIIFRCVVKIAVFFPLIKKTFFDCDEATVKPLSITFVLIFRGKFARAREKKDRLTRLGSII